VVLRLQQLHDGQQVVLLVILAVEFTL
jgi:hypothetical protein